MVITCDVLIQSESVNIVPTSTVTEPMLVSQFGSAISVKQENIDSKLHSVEHYSPKYSSAKKLPY